MKAPDIFIIIPAALNRTYYIRPYDIVSLLEESRGSTSVSYKTGEGIYSFRSLLTAKEIHERIIELEEANFKYTFGEE